MACLRIGGVRIAVSSAKAQLLDRNMYRTVGIAPEAMKILVNKSSVHFRADFAAIARRSSWCARQGLSSPIRRSCRGSTWPRKCARGHATPPEIHPAVKRTV
jgi:microcystin degradation protein MlrC